MDPPPRGRTAIWARPGTEELVRLQTLPSKYGYFDFALLNQVQFDFHFVLWSSTFYR